MSKHQYKVGDKIKFKEEKQRYTVRAIGLRYIVCNKPFNILKTVLYTIIDFEKNVRGPENLIFGRGAETVEHCEAMIDRLEGAGIHDGRHTEVSRRRSLPLHIEATPL